MIVLTRVRGEDRRIEVENILPHVCVGIKDYVTKADLSTEMDCSGGLLNTEAPLQFNGLGCGAGDMERLRRATGAEEDDRTHITARACVGSNGRISDQDFFDPFGGVTESGKFSRPVRLKSRATQNLAKIDLRCAIPPC